MLGKESDDYELDYDEAPEDSDTGKPQLILHGARIEQDTIEKLQSVGFQFLYAQSIFADDDDEEDVEEEDEEDVEEVEAGTDEDEDEVIADLEIVFEDMKTSGKRGK